MKRSNISLHWMPRDRCICLRSIVGAAPLRPVVAPHSPSFSSRHVGPQQLRQFLAPFLPIFLPHGQQPIQHVRQ
jgi:hypothetical protein